MKIINLFYVVLLTIVGVGAINLLANNTSDKKVRIYTYSWCGYCNKVKQFVNVNNISQYVIYVDAEQDNNKQELLKLISKKACPFMDDQLNNVKMGDSGKILDHLQKHFVK